MLIPNKFNGYHNGTRQLHISSGGGGGGTTQTTSTVQNTNIPDYARSYVENMLGATQQQLFQGTRTPTVTNPDTGEVTGGEFNITGFKPYQAYGGTYDAQGNQLSYDPSKGIAAYSPLQTAAQTGIAGLTIPQEMKDASEATKLAFHDARRLGQSYQASTYGNQFTNPGAYQNTSFTSQYNTPGAYQEGTFTNQFNTPTAYEASRFGGQQVSAPMLDYLQMDGVQGLNTAYAGNTNLGSAPTSQAAFANQAMLNAAPTTQAAYGTEAILGAAPTYQGQQLGYTPKDVGYQQVGAERVNALPLERLQMQAAGNVGTGSFTQPGAASQYMSPYMQSVVNTQQREVQRQADIAAQSRGAAAARSGAFGGSRQAIENAEAARNLATQKGDIQAQGLQSAFQQAQQQYNTEQQTALQAALANQQVQQQTGVQNLSALLQTQGLAAQTGLSAQQSNQQAGLQANLANQAAGIDTSKFNQQQQYNTAAQNAQLAQQQQLANQSLQGQYGLQQGQMTQQMALANQANAQQANLANQALQGQYGIQQGQFGQQMSLANLNNAQQTGLANQALQGQYGMQQGQMNQAINLANQAAQNQAAAQNQQMSYNVGQQNLAAKLGVQQLGAGQNLQASLANQQNQLAAQQAYEQSRQYGAGQGLTAAQLAAQYGLSAQQAQEQSRQFGANQGQTSAQLAAQYGLSAQQAAEQSKQFGSTQGLNAAQLSAQYGLAGQQLSEQAKQFGGQYGLQANAQALGAANQYGALGNQMLQAQQGIYGLQNQVGGQQQAYQQSILNQAIQDYANAQQYPLMQLGTMSNMLRGLPMQASTTNQYAASPNPLSQAIGTIGAGASIYNAYNPAPRGAAGGEVKGYAKGGILSYDMGGEVESQLENMDEKGLQVQARESSSPSIRRMAQRLLRERQMGKQPQSADAANVQYQAAQPQMPAMRGGGIIAFKTGGGANEEGGEDEAKIGMQERLAMPAPTTGGIMGATTQPTTPIPVAPAGPSPDVVKEATRQRDIYSAQATRPTADVIKEIQAEREALGVGDNKPREELRAQQMAERANLSDEKERQRNMRLAEFFASWASTPGPVLVAGMNALKQSIPNLISDEKEAKKARREADKIIYDIDEATRLEKLGLHDKAVARIEKAASHAQDFNKQLLTFQSQRESDKRALEQTTMSTQAQLEAARIQAAAQSGATSQRAKESEMYNIERSLEIARNRLAKIEQDVAKTMATPPPKSALAKAISSVQSYNNQLAVKKGVVEDVPEYMRKDAEQAQKVISDYEKDAKRRIGDAQRQVNMYEETYLNRGRGANLNKTAPSATDDPFGIMDILKEPPASAAPAAAAANAPTKTSSRTGDASSVNPYVDTKGKAKPDAPKGEPSKASKLVDQAVPVVKDVANKVANELSGSELRYLKDKIDRNEKLSVTDRIRAERAGLL